MSTPRRAAPGGQGTLRDLVRCPAATAAVWGLRIERPRESALIDGIHAAKKRLTAFIVVKPTGTRIGTICGLDNRDSNLVLEYPL
jgi:hypothetical protein